MDERPTGSARNGGESGHWQSGGAVPGARGYDVAITARTVQEGETREHSSTLEKSNTTPLPGSLTSTAALIEAEGRKAMVVPADLTDFGRSESPYRGSRKRWGASTCW